MLHGYEIGHFLAWAKTISKQDPKMEGDENGEWRKFHDEDLRDLYCSSNIVRVIESQRLK